MELVNDCRPEAAADQVRPVAAVADLKLLMMDVRRLARRSGRLIG
jgi:hypothetical protein